MKLIIASLLCLGLLLGSVAPALAQTETQQTVCQNLRGAVRQECLAANDSTVTDLAATAIDILSLIIGAVSVLVIVIAGLMYVLSGGNPDRTKQAKDAILYAIVGIVIAAAAQLIVRFVLSSV